MNRRFSILAAAMILIAAALLPLPRGDKIAGLPSVCGLWNWFEIPCPFCGLTRSFVCFAHGDWAQSFAFHPLGPALFCGLIIFLVGSIFRPNWKPSKRFRNFGLTTATTAISLTWILRLNGVLPLP